jgi:hypothetical protein
LQEQSTVVDYAEMMGLFLVFCVRSMNDDDLRWSWQYSFNAEQEQCLTTILLVYWRQFMG